MSMPVFECNSSLEICAIKTIPIVLQCLCHIMRATLSTITVRNLLSNLHDVKSRFYETNVGVDGRARTNTARSRSHESVNQGLTARLLKILPAGLVTAVGLGTVHVGVNTI
jgi:hypothetical protein